MQLHKVHIERMSHKAGWSKRRRVASEFGAGSWWPEGTLQHRKSRKPPLAPQGPHSLTSTPVHLYPCTTCAPSRAVRCTTHHICTPAHHALHPRLHPRASRAAPRTTHHICTPAHHALHPRMHPCASRAASTHAPPRVTRCTTHHICTPTHHVPRPTNSAAHNKLA